MTIEPLEYRQLLSAYFIDAANGSDSNTGRSAHAAWQTLAAVSAHSFKPGDKILVTGSFSGQTLTLGPTAAGVSVNSYVANGARNAVRIGVAGAAVFTNVTADGIDITTSNVTVQDITIQASPDAVATGNYNYGIYLHNDTSAVLTHEVINHVSATGFSYSGLCMQGWNTSPADSAGFSNVLIENSAFFSNQVSGIFVGTGDTTGNEFQPAFPADLYVNSNLTIKACQAYDNAGYNAALHGTPDGVNINQGNYTSGGIFISSVSGATVQNCAVYNNCFAAFGSVGQWAFDATRVNFLRDDSYDNKTAGNGDGDGFDFDHGTTHSIMQYDYSHGNQGAGYLVATIGGTSTNNGDTIRYCVAANNNGGIGLISSAGAPILYANIYNNTLLAPDTTDANSSAISIVGDPGASMNVLNNIFYSGGTQSVVVITSADANLHFDRNDYWLAGTPGGFSMYLAGATYTTLADWSAAAGGEEVSNGKNIGLIQDPMLNDETLFDVPIAGVADFALSHRSPLRAEGLSLAIRQWAGTSPFNQNAPYNLAGSAWGGIGRVNFYGHPINRRAIGAG